MKKNVMRIAALLLLLSLLLSLTACGENAKRQEAVDAYSKAADAYNVMADKMNNYADVIDEDILADCQSMGDMLQRYSDILNTRDDLTDDQYEEMISWFASVEDWTGEIKDMLDASFG